jgi:UDP-2,3-diacylglucosamine pyrophosphatase LpxH
MSLACIVATRTSKPFSKKGGFMSDEPRFLLILSDLHLSEGWDKCTGLLSRREDFFFDTSFKRFLSKQAQIAKDKRCRIRLIFAGDLVDFQQVVSTPGGERAKYRHGSRWRESLSFGRSEGERHRRLGLSTSADHTVWKLERIIAGHEVFFKALADFLAKGHDLVILPGNHDIEWIIPQVQQAFIERVTDRATRHDRQSIPQRIEFSPWFYYEPNLIWVEHGNQYDPLDSFDYLLHPFLPNGLIDLTAGCFFVRYLFNHVEFTWPFADNIKPPSRFILWALGRSEGRRYVPEYFRFFLEISKKRRLPNGWKKKLCLIHAECLRQLSHTAGISEVSLQELKGLWEPTALHSLGKYKLFMAFLRGTPNSRALRNKAYYVKKILDVPYVVFGHTHEAYRNLFSRGKRKAEYFNSGTWTKVFTKSMEERLLKEESEFVYVQLDRAERKIEFLRWRDDLNAGERVLLFEEPKKKGTQERC